MYLSLKHQINPNSIEGHIPKHFNMDLKWLLPVIWFLIFRNYDPFERLTIPNIRFTAWSFSLRLFSFCVLLLARSLLALISIIWRTWDRTYLIFVTNATNVVSAKFSTECKKFLMNSKILFFAQFGVILRTFRCNIFRFQKTLD